MDDLSTFQKNLTDTIQRCVCCGAQSFAFRKILWPELCEEWGLSREEIEYVDIQQGFHCTECGSNARSMTLAQAIMEAFHYEGIFRNFANDPRAAGLDILEINEAGNLTQFISKLPRYKLITYPDYDMTALKLGDQAFDLVIHSDTLEHVPNPVRGLSECRRVLRSGGVLAYTVPMIVERLTRTRAGLPKSYHGEKNGREDHIVQTEYGADAWREIIKAGFSSCTIHSIAHPSAHAFVAIR